MAGWPTSRGKHRGPSRVGPDSPSWRGGRYISDDGYVMIWVGKGAPMADVKGYVYEHRLVASRRIGRPLLTEEQVHHEDENRQNNDPSNLKVVTLPEHKVEHRILDVGRRMPGETNPLVDCGCGCGSKFERYDGYGRPRKVISGHNRTGVAPKKAAVLALVRGGMLHQQEIADKIGRSLGTARGFLTKLANEGLIQKTSPALWVAVERI